MTETVIIIWLHGRLVRGARPVPAQLGGGPLEPSSYRPVCLLNSTYKILSAAVTDRLDRLCERHWIRVLAQERLRRLRCTQRQVQSLHWAIEKAARDGAPPSTQLTMKLVDWLGGLVQFLHKLGGTL